MFYIVFELHGIVHITAIEMGLNKSGALLNGRVIYKSKLPTSDPFLLIVSQAFGSRFVVEWVPKEN